MLGLFALTPSLPVPLDVAAQPPARRELHATFERMTTTGFTPYFNYDGNLLVSGAVTLESESTKNDTQTFSYSLAGVDPRCLNGAGKAANSCGIHIHKGKSCAADALGHYFGETIAADPWGAVAYTSSTPANDTSGTFTVVNGLCSHAIKGTVFVAHDFYGRRIACSLIGVDEVAEAEEMEPPPAQQWPVAPDEKTAEFRRGMPGWQQMMYSGRRPVGVQPMYQGRPVYYQQQTYQPQQQQIHRQQVYQQQQQPMYYIQPTYTQSQPMMAYASAQTAPAQQMYAQPQQMAQASGFNGVGQAGVFPSDPPPEAEHSHGHPMQHAAMAVLGLSGGLPTWHIGRVMQSCNAVCADQGKACDEVALNDGTADESKEVEAIALRLGQACAFTVTEAEDFGPAICSHEGDCVYALPAPPRQRLCSTSSSHYQRICPCH
ncbi:hypothetical protein EMIHUDRAFT_445508 [Emiliania huxleyi CCMP1516]|uniref:Alpha-1,6-mannosyl-glycoprotein 6-beta-N-acetylglucosaminyltransferase n=2 Tax=Emiliania huxleyi TaxID=2903 RepID=A0A0D3IXU1_EMIH1|nr:hypothetical protein EMIHUDRAFT_445508 [Emiliania huxleyi CCMP1516]EOD16076.1 hypothetical protein EMIHUDRAFT_445508 [Emiliania huxleyi CCMP1516]|eukprot:XP_005768505.1 hypothetical protein EMIHUDRAFT_445508 [Emiliania huxleyi CCMP1516]